MTKGKGRNPGASGLDKHIKRKEHKERSQLAFRERLGQLEKHKDYILRAKKRKLKQQRLQQVKRAAAQRNPDEFHIGMTKAVMDMATGRMKQRRKGKGYDERQKDLKSALVHNNQNVQYLEFKAESDRQRAKELLEEDVAGALVNTKPVNTHIVFTESAEEFQKFNALKHFDTTPEMLRMHPLARGKIEVMKNTIMPEELLLSGHHMKTASQKRTERKRIQNALRRMTDATEEEKDSAVERMRRKMRRGGDADTVAFADLVAGKQGQHAGGGRDGDEEDEDEEREEAKDPLKQLQSLREEKDRQDALVAARRVKEVAQRMERSKSLSTLAKTIRRQNEGIKRQLEQRKESRYKPNATRRSR